MLVGHQPVNRQIGAGGAPGRRRFLQRVGDGHRLRTALWRDGSVCSRQVSRQGRRMCGIAGGVALDPASRPDRKRVERISRLLAHRGPDADGLWVSPSGRAVLAHRRLSVIDIESGAQPMVGEDSGLGLVFNGEIYNYRELRETQLRRGARFRTASDTEVRVRAFERDGSQCVRDLRGMFAFAFWDDARGRLTAARARVGKKPVDYRVSDGCLYFTSSR